MRPGATVLDNFTLRIPAGKVTALVGESGSGKSTIIGLIERWYNPLSGSVTLDDRPIDQLNLNWLRKNVRLVQQEPVLFSGTVYQNISNGLIGTPVSKKIGFKQKVSKAWGRGALTWRKTANFRYTSGRMSPNPKSGDESKRLLKLPMLTISYLRSPKTTTPS